MKFKKLNASHKCLKIENEKLQCKLISSHSTQIDNLKEENHNLFSENGILTKENWFLKSECKLLNTRISDLDRIFLLLNQNIKLLLIMLENLTKEKKFE